MIVVSDATPLIALAKIDKLSLLTELFGRITIPQAVYDEVVTNALNRPGSQAVQKADWIDLRIVDNQIKVAYLRTDLDPGESESLVLAEELNANWILLDEQKARLAAQLIGLNFVGTVGVLLFAKQMKKIDRIRPLLDELREKNFHLSKRVYRTVLQQANE
jgi:hypothetical protein